MSINSVNTNMGAMIALQSLNKTNESLAATQKRISTGQRVADSTDDGAAYAVAQTVRSTVGGLTTANQQLGNVQGLLSTTQSGLNDISNTMASMRNVLVTLGDGTVQGDQRTQYKAQYSSLLANVKSFIQDNAYSGKSLIGDFIGAKSQGNVVRNETGATCDQLRSAARQVYLARLLTATAALPHGLRPALAGGAFMNQMNR
jgi:flagellin